MRWLKKHFSRDMVRPLIYKVFTRGILALLAAQLMHRFAPETWPLTMFSNLSLALGVLFLLGAALAWLRLDGIKIPQMKLLRVKRKDPYPLNADMADFVDEEITRFEDLDEEAQNSCVLLADLVLAAVCLILAAVL